MEKKMAERHIAEYDTAIGHGIQECHKYHVEQWEKQVKEYALYNFVYIKFKSVKNRQMVQGWVF